MKRIVVVALCFCAAICFGVLPCSADAGQTDVKSARYDYAFVDEDTGYAVTETVASADKLSAGPGTSINADPNGFVSVFAQGAHHTDTVLSFTFDEARTKAFIRPHETYGFGVQGVLTLSGYAAPGDEVSLIEQSTVNYSGHPYQVDGTCCGLRVADTTGRGPIAIRLPVNYSAAWDEDLDPGGLTWAIHLSYTIAIDHNKVLNANNGAQLTASAVAADIPASYVNFSYTGNVFTLPEPSALDQLAGGVVSATFWVGRKRPAGFRQLWQRGRRSLIRPLQNRFSTVAERRQAVPRTAVRDG